MAEEFHPVDVDNLIEQVWISMWESTIQELDRELWPYIEKLNVLEPGQYEDSSVKQLFNWLVDKKRTSEDFNYVFGPVVQSMNKYNTRATYVQYNIEINEVCPLFLGFLSAEALAVKKPILLGLWENVAWFFVKFITDFQYEINEVQQIPDHLNDWVICMMADPDLCPNPFLRLEFMNIFGNIVNLNDDNERKAFQSVMITCSTLNRDPIKDFLSIGDNCSKILWSILSILGKFSDSMCTDDFDQQLSDKLLIVFSTVIPNAQCFYKMDSNINKWSYEVNFFSVLFQTISRFTHQLYNKFHQNLNASHADLIAILDDFFVISHNSTTILLHFKRSCETPQLVDDTASCIMDILETGLMINIVLLANRNAVYHASLNQTSELLEQIGSNYISNSMIDDTLISPVGQTLIHKYHVRFSNLRQQLEQLSSVQLAFLSLDDYDLICSILYHCNYYT